MQLLLTTKKVKFSQIIALFVQVTPLALGYDQLCISCAICALERLSDPEISNSSRLSTVEGSICASEVFTHLAFSIFRNKWSPSQRESKAIELEDKITNTATSNKR